MTPSMNSILRLYRHKRSAQKALAELAAECARESCHEENLLRIRQLMEQVRHFANLYPQQAEKMRCSDLQLEALVRKGLMLRLASLMQTAENALMRDISDGVAQGRLHQLVAEMHVQAATFSPEMLPSLKEVRLQHCGGAMWQSPYLLDMVFNGYVDSLGKAEPQRFSGESLLAGAAFFAGTDYVQPFISGVVEKLRSASAEQRLDAVRTDTCLRQVKPQLQLKLHMPERRSNVVQLYADGVRQRAG